MVNGEASQAQGFFLAKLTRSLSQTPSCTSSKPPRALAYAKTNELKLSLDLDLDLDLEQLPQGTCAVFDDKVYFLPQVLDKILTNELRFKGLLLGKIHGGTFVPNPHCKSLSPKKGQESCALIFDELEPIYALLEGQSLATTLSSKSALLYFRNLPLSWLSIKQGRALLSHT